MTDSSPDPENLKAQFMNLRAGEVSVVFDRGMLRYIKLGQHELLWGIYAAVRDANWGTVPFNLEDIRLEHTPNSFTLSFTSIHQQGDSHFIWQGKVTGEPNGKITFSFDGKAQSTFKRNRIGFCVLHPMSAAGTNCMIKHADGTVTSGRFPKTIAPHQPFKNIRSIIHEAAEGLRIKVTMHGDTFEMEDQRNWTDASFKTYCTPLELPFPVEVEKGTRVRQEIIVEVDAEQTSHKRTDEGLIFSLTRASKNLPNLGLGAARRPLKPVEIERLETLNLDHLRLDLNLQSTYSKDLERVADEVKSLSCKLELALHLSDNAEVEFEVLKENLNALQPPLARILVFHKNEKSSSGKWLELVRGHFPGIPLAGGTDAFFTELNRERPQLAALDQVTYSLNPQVHAFDNASLIETLPAQAATAESAAGFSADKPIIISPITFKMRNNPNATGDKRLSLEQQIDTRQHSLFGASWTLGSLKHLFESSVSSLTYFETIGELGVMRDAEHVYPLYHVFADVAEFAGGKILGSSSNKPLSFEGLVLQKKGSERILLANFSAEPQTVQLSGFTGSYQGRMLDENTVEQATRDPKAFRAAFPLTYKLEEGSSLTLEPYALLTLDKSL